MNVELVDIVNIMETEKQTQKKLKSVHQNGVAHNQEKTEEAVNKSVALQVHHCKFFEWMPSLITSVAFSLDGKYLATSLVNGNIEIRNINNGWLVERV